MSKVKKDKDFERRFDAFLKESMSSDDGSIDSAKLSKYFEPTKKKNVGKKDDKLWWMQDDNDEDDENLGSNFGSGLTATGKSFLKKKKPVDAASTPKQTDKMQPKHSTPKQGALGDADVEKPDVTPIDDSFTKQKARTGLKKDSKPVKSSRGKGDASMSKDSLEDISEKSEEDSTKDRRLKRQIQGKSYDSGKSDLGGKTGPGFDTLDEMRDKENFFKNLEKNADGTIDYERLNQELSHTGTSLSPGPEAGARPAASLAAIEDIEEGDVEPSKQVPASQQKRHAVDQDPAAYNKPSMLSKVSLLDSLESTMNTTGSPQVGRSGVHDSKQREGYDDVDGPSYDDVDGPNTRFSAHHTGTGAFMGTNTSQEIEALQKALREVGLSPTIYGDSHAFDQSSNANTAEMMKKLLNSQTGKQRNVDEILKEMESVEKRREQSHNEPDVELLSEKAQKKHSPRSPRGLERQLHIDVQEEEEARGFDLSPIHDSSARGFDQSHTEDTEMYQPVTQVREKKMVKSVTERGRPKKKSSKTKVADSSKQTAQSTKRKHSPKSSHYSISPNSSPRRRFSPQVSPRKDETRRSRSWSPEKQAFNSSMKFAHVKSSGYGKVSPARAVRDRKHWETLKGTAKSRPATARESTPPSHSRKRPNMTWSPAEVAKQKIKGSESPTRNKKGGTIKVTSGLDSQLKASVDSFANYIKDHFAAFPEVQQSIEEPLMTNTWKSQKVATTIPEGSVNDVDYWKHMYEEEKRLHLRVKADINSMEKEYEKMLENQKSEYEEQMFKLKQEIYVLSAKMPDADSDNKKRATDGVSSDKQIEKLDKEIQEQEKLIAGYEQENKRLYDQLRNMQKQGKCTEEHMFKENQKMATELANLKTLLDQKEMELKNKGVITSLAAQQEIARGDQATVGGGRIAQLQAELKEALKKEENSKKEFEIAMRNKCDLENHVDKLVKEREALKQQIERSKALKSDEAKVIEENYKAENEKLNKKLRWYAENQKLLDSDSYKMKEKDEEIRRLKARIEEINSETGKRVEENKFRAKERAADAKKIMDLQRQVKEMEGIIRRRHPNSLPALMMTAAIAPDEPTSGKTPTVVVLESRLKKLEAELESKDAESEKMLRAVEQKYLNIKIQYEDRISDLEKQLSIYKGCSTEHPHTHAGALERELENVKDKYKKKTAVLQEELERHTTEISKLKKLLDAKSRSEGRLSPSRQNDLEEKVQILEKELETKSKEMQVIYKSLERLRKEKQHFLSSGGKTKKVSGKKSSVEIKDMEMTEEGLSLTDRVNMDRQYEPHDFTDTTHINDVLNENERLKAQVDQLQIELQHKKLELHKSQAVAESFVRKSREELDEKVESLKASHKREIQRIIADKALEHSMSEVVELRSKVDAQNVMIVHLKEQLAKAQVECEHFSVLKIKYEGLKTKVEQLQEQLREAKKFHTPEMKHYESIQEKIASIEKRHEQREQELQQVIKNAQQVASVELSEEVSKWKQVVEAKNLEIQKFRTELDSILEVLRLLQKQGVVIPVSVKAS